MVALGVQRVVLVGLALLASLGRGHSTQFNFPDCVDDCIGSNGCGTSNPKCMCMAAKGTFLVQIVTCMFKYCATQPLSVNSDFLDIMQQGCAALKAPIPQDKISAAESVAASLAGHLPPLTTSSSSSATTQPQTHTVTATATTTAAPASTSSESSTDTPSSTPTSDSGSPSSAAPTPSDTPSTTPVVASPPPETTFASPTPTTDSQQTPTTGAPPRDTTDSSPFTNTNAAPGFGLSWLAAGVPLVAALKLAL